MNELREKVIAYNRVVKEALETIFMELIKGQ